jgi:hypothetical protein
MRPHRYVFNHFPKTGGLSFIALCRQNLAEADISPHLSDIQLRRARRKRFERYRLIRGHFSIPSQIRVAPDRYAMTLIRHPIRTIASLYQYWRTAPDQSAAISKARELSFPEFVRYYADSPMVVDNPYTHHFAALGINMLGTLADADTLRSTARQNLAAFDFIGLCEEFEASARLLSTELDWRIPVDVPRENSSGSERVFEQIDPETMDFLVERNLLDLELYEYGRALFHQRCKRASQASQWPEASARPRPDQNQPIRFVPFPARPVTERAATIHRVSAVWAGGATARTLQIAIRFRTKERIDGLVAGVAIHNAGGDLVYGNNTNFERLAVQTGTNRDCYAVFFLECRLPPGSYAVTVGLTDLRQLGFHYHWIDSAATFEVPPGDQSGRHQTVCLRRFESTVDSAFASRDCGGDFVTTA